MNRKIVISILCMLMVVMLVSSVTARPIILKNVLKNSFDAKFERKKQQFIDIYGENGYNELFIKVQLEFLNMKHWPVEYGRYWLNENGTAYNHNAGGTWDMLFYIALLIMMSFCVMFGQNELSYSLGGIAILTLLVIPCLTAGFIDGFGYCFQAVIEGFGLVGTISEMFTLFGIFGTIIYLSIILPIVIVSCFFLYIPLSITYGLELLFRVLQEAIEFVRDNKVLT